MAISAGDSECSTGLSKALYDALLADGRIPWPASMTSEQQQTPKAVAYAIASKVAEAVNADALTVHAAYTSASGQSFPPSTATVVNFSTKEEDTHNAVWTGANWQFTVPAGKGGRYLVTACCTFGGNVTATYALLSARVDGAERRRLGRESPTSSSWPSVSGSAVLTLAAGNVVALTLSHDSSDVGGEALEANAAANYVTITRLGD